MSEMPAGELEYRQATLAGVSFPDRIIELIVMPYEEETLVEHRGRMVTEIISRGAFDGIEKRPARVKANRDHDDRRVVGKAVSFHPDAAEGLVAEVKVSDTELGRETLILADDGVLDVSAGFVPMADGERWETRARRRIVRAWLGHVALVPDPAYTGAKVLAVRAQNASGGLTDVSARPPETPRLNVVRGWLLEDSYSSFSVGG